MPDRLLKPEEAAAVVDAIARAERATSGEIRVHLENYCRGNALDRAVELFTKLGMQQTVARNGVILYIAIKDRKVAIYGDAGIHEQVKDDFWQEELQILLAHFREGRYQQGLVTVIGQVGDKLRTFFPYQNDDSNELSNEISYGDQ